MTKIYGAMSCLIAAVKTRIRNPKLRVESSIQKTIKLCERHFDYKILDKY